MPEAPPVMIATLPSSLPNFVPPAADSSIPRTPKGRNDANHASGPAE